MGSGKVEKELNLKSLFAKCFQKRKILWYRLGCNQLIFVSRRHPLVPLVIQKPGQASRELVNCQTVLDKPIVRGHDVDIPQRHDSPRLVDPAKVRKVFEVPSGERVGIAPFFLVAIINMVKNIFPEFDFLFFHDKIFLLLKGTGTRFNSVLLTMVRC